MNFFDLLIIYLACGAPFAVYYFVNNRRKHRVFLKTLLISLVWIPLAIRLLQNFVTKELPKSSLLKKDEFDDEEIFAAKKRLENIFIKRKSVISIFELREILDRYIGLTGAAHNRRDGGEESDTEFFEIAGTPNAKLAAKCLYRRNHRLLFFHQTLAGQDFLKTISGFVTRFPADQEIEQLSLKLAGLLNDEKTVKNLKLLFGAKRQRRDDISVRESEKELWKNELHPQPPTANNAL